MNEKQNITYQLQMALQLETDQRSNQINAEMVTLTDKLPSTSNYERTNDELILQEIWGDVEQEIIKYKNEDENDKKNDIQVILNDFVNQFSTLSNKYGEVDRNMNDESELKIQQQTSNRRTIDDHQISLLKINIFIYKYL